MPSSLQAPLDRGPRELPSLSALQAFEAAARHRSFTRAARELSVTQGAVSRQVANLEALLGAELFHRESPGVRPTRAAEAYAVKVRAILERLSALTLEFQASGGEGPALRLAILPTFGTTWLIPRLPGFFAEHPRVSIDLTASLVTFDFETTELDVAIHYGEGVWPGARVEPLMEEQVVVVCSPEHGRDLALEAPADLARATLLQLAGRPASWEHWCAARGAEGVPARRGPRFANHLMILQAVKAGLGVALLPTFLVEEALREGTLVEPLADSLVHSPQAYWLVYPERSLELSALHAFRGWLRAELERAGLG